MQDETWSETNIFPHSLRRPSAADQVKRMSATMPQAKSVNCMQFVIIVLLSIELDVFI